ncbi:MAG TPA: hypothetical protein EYP78_00295 [Candidatus Omnitrophica bacterium]|nr:hypothetical protein [Candidatus Omnitrophota bacterium]
MGLDEILEKIEQKNRKDIESIRRQTQQRCEEIKREAEREAEELKRRGKDEATKKADELKQHILQEARLHVSREILKTKSRILDEAFEEALGRLESLPVKEYLDWMEKLLLRTLELGENEIILSRKDTERFDVEEFLGRVNEKVMGRSSVKISSENRPINGGFILKQKRKEINCSFQSLLEEKLDALRVKIGRMLFQ